MIILGHYKLSFLERLSSSWKVIYRCSFLIVEVVIYYLKHLQCMYYSYNMKTDFLLKNKK